VLLFLLDFSMVKKQLIKTAILNCLLVNNKREWLCMIL